MKSLQLPSLTDGLTEQMARVEQLKVMRIIMKLNARRLEETIGGTRTDTSIIYCMGQWTQPKPMQIVSRRRMQIICLVNGTATIRTRTVSYTCMTLNKVRAQFAARIINLARGGRSSASLCHVAAGIAQFIRIKICTSCEISCPLRLRLRLRRHV